MKKYKLKVKLLVYGFPFLDEKFVIDNFELKAEKIDLSVIEKSIEDNPFIPAGYMLNCTFQLKDDENTYYNCFEIVEELEYNVSNDKAKSKETVIKHFFEFSELEELINNFKKKLRLIYNLRIIFPVCKVSIMDANDKLVGYFINYNDFPSQHGLGVFFDKEKFSKNSRSGFDLKSFLLTEKSNVKFNRAMSLFNDSFESSDVSVRFLLLFSCLEALFITSKTDITENLAICTSRILLYDSSAEEKAMYDKIKELYDYRCKFVHGRKIKNITYELELELREIVRYVLLIYWNICLSGKTSNQIIRALKNNEKISLQTRMYAKAIRCDDYSQAYKEMLCTIALEIAKGNVRITEQENGVIKSVEEI